jgi:hypothetical protein
MLFPMTIKKQPENLCQAAKAGLSPALLLRKRHQRNTDQNK